MPTESSGRKQTVNGLPMRLGMVRPGMVWLAEAFCWKAFVYSGLCGGGRTSKMTRCGLGKAWHGVSLTLKSGCLAGLVQGEGGGRDYFARSGFWKKSFLEAGCPLERHPIFFLSWKCDILG